MSKKLNIPGLEINKYEWLALLMKSNLSHGPKLRGFAIYTFINDQGFAWPNQEDIEKAIGGKSIKKTSKYINLLKNTGWIKVEKSRIDAMRFSNSYRLSLPYTHEVGY
jgi:hypothetical protein